MSEQMSMFDTSAEYYDGANEDLDINDLNFRVHASIIYKLGESLIADEVTALSELIKNAYDADASYCEVVIDPEFVDDNGQVGKIRIRDDGSGMDLRTVVNGWLTISNSVKKKMKKENKTTAIFNRVPLGEKGLGRLSVQKLGSTVTIITKVKESKSEIRLVIPWGEFLQNTTLDRIPINCEEVEVNNSCQYTEIIITGLINPVFWTSDEVRKDLEKTINKIISPFRFNDNNFIISARIGNFDIDVNNDMFNSVLNTARAAYSFQVTETGLKMTLNYKVDFFKKRSVYRDFDWFEFNFDYFQEMFEDVKLKFDGAKFNIDDKNIFQVSYNIPLEGLSYLKRNMNGELFYQGDFDGEIYDFSYDSKYVSTLLEEYDLGYALREQEYKEYIKSNNGIKVIRDGFVVQGYGDGAVDWLKISTQATTSGSFFDLKNENVIGYIKLSGKHNQVLKETTSREGFINDEYYTNFYKIIRESIIKKINTTNKEMTETFKMYLNKIAVSDDPEMEFPVEKVEKIASEMMNVSKEIKAYTKKIKEQIEKKKQVAKERSMETNFLLDGDAYTEYQEVIQLQDKIIDELNNKISSLSKDVESLRNSCVIIKSDYESFNRRISDIFELAGLGISVELFTHELYTTINNVNEHLKRMNVDSIEIDYIANSMNSLRKQISYFYPGLKFVRMRKEVITLNGLITSHLEFYSKQATNKDIELCFSEEKNDIAILANRGMLNQVLDNLFSNSMYWLVYSRDTMKCIKDCKYNIVINGDFTIDVWDNGMGISKEIEKELFNPFVSSKEGGRGLGLFICKQNLENNNSSIRLLRERNNYGNLYKFRIDLSNLKNTKDKI